MCGMNHRPERVQSLIQVELGKLLLKEVEFPALVTITSVEVDKKLGIARVKISVMPSSFNKEALSIAQRAQGELQHLLMKKINIKPMPKIKFEIDYGSENAAHVEELIIKNPDLQEDI